MSLAFILLKNSNFSWERFLSHSKYSCKDLLKNLKGTNWLKSRVYKRGQTTYWDKKSKKENRKIKKKKFKGNIN